MAVSLVLTALNVVSRLWAKDPFPHARSFPMKYVAVLACALLPAFLGCDVNVTVKSGEEGSTFELRTSEEPTSQIHDRDKAIIELIG